MPACDYIVTMPDGTKTVMEVNNVDTLPINITNLSGKALEDACLRLFSNLGWTVRKEEVVNVASGMVQPDFVLSDGDREFGYVEVITSTNADSLAQKKNVIQVMVDQCKPDVFIITNGMVFDIFYKGKFAGSMSNPPSPATVKQNARLMSYCNAFMKLQKDLS